VKTVSGRVVRPN